MKILTDNGIIKQEICSDETDGIYIFRFQILQISESRFVIRPLEALFCPKENNEDEAFFTKFEYNDDTHSKIAAQDIKTKYEDLIDYIYKTNYPTCNNLVSVCSNIFRNNSNTVHIYYLYPSGTLFKIIEYDKTKHKIDMYIDEDTVVTLDND